MYDPWYSLLTTLQMMLFRVACFFVLLSCCLASSLLLHQAEGGNGVTGDIWFTTFVVNVSEAHTYTLANAQNSNVYVDDHIGVSVDGSAFDYFNFFTVYTESNCTIRGAGSVTGVAPNGSSASLPIAKVAPGLHTVVVKLYNCVGPYGNNDLILIDDSNKDIFVSISRQDVKR
jgi:hypothetical protein